MKVFKVYKDEPDPYDSDYQEYGYFYSEEVAKEYLKHIITEELVDYNVEPDTDKLKTLFEEGKYLTNSGGYYVSEIKVKDIKV